MSPQLLKASLCSFVRHLLSVFHGNSCCVVKKQCNESGECDQNGYAAICCYAAIFIDMNLAETLLTLLKRVKAG